MNFVKKNDENRKATKKVELSCKRRSFIENHKRKNQSMIEESCGSSSNLEANDVMSEENNLSDGHVTEEINKINTNVLQNFKVTINQNKSVSKTNSDCQLDTHNPTEKILKTILRKGDRKNCINEHEKSQNSEVEMKEFEEYRTIEVVGKPNSIRMLHFQHRSVSPSIPQDRSPPLSSQIYPSVTSYTRKKDSPSLHNEMNLESDPRESRYCDDFS